MLCYSVVAIVVAICISVNINAYSHNKLHIRSFINRLSSNNVNEVTTKTTKGNYCLNVTLHVKPDRIAEFLECIKANRLGTMTTESKAVQYTWGRSTTDQTMFHFHEQYLDEDGFTAHTHTKHFENWERFASTDPFLQPPEVVFFEEYV